MTTATTNRHLDARIYSVRVEAIRRMKGFERHLSVPTKVDHSALRLVEQLTHNELDRDLQDVFDRLRSAFKFKRREISVFGPEQCRGVIETPLFVYEISVQLDEDDPSQVLWSREINGIFGSGTVTGEQLDASFDRGSWALEIAFSQSLDLADIIDHVEDLDSDTISIDYDKDLTSCSLRIVGVTSSLRITQHSLQLCHDTTTSPRELMQALTQFRERLASQSEVDLPAVFDVIP